MMTGDTERKHKVQDGRELMLHGKTQNNIKGLI